VTQKESHYRIVFLLRNTLYTRAQFVVCVSGCARES